MSNGILIAVTSIGMVAASASLLAYYNSLSKQESEEKEDGINLTKSSKTAKKSSNKLDEDVPDDIKTNLFMWGEDTQGRHDNNHGSKGGFFDWLGGNDGNDGGFGGDGGGGGD